VANARSLLLTHIPMQDGGAWALEEARAVYDGKVEIAEPLRTYEV
jgi:ribonuclease BN (tRNA processing enzyme)